MPNSIQGRVFSRRSGTWQAIGYVATESAPSTMRLPAELLERGPIEAVDKAWDDLRIGDRAYEVHPNFPYRSDVRFGSTAP